MDALKIEGTDDSPAINLDPENNTFQFSGKSLPENPTGFYQPILDWLDSYASSPNAESKFVFKLDYFNTASAKLFLDILLKLESMHEQGNNIHIDWFYREEDEDMQGAGKVYEDMIEIPFEHIGY